MHIGEHWFCESTPRFKVRDSMWFCVTMSSFIYEWRPLFMRTPKKRCRFFRPPNRHNAIITFWWLWNGCWLSVDTPYSWVFKGVKTLATVNSGNPPGQSWPHFRWVGDQMCVSALSLSGKRILQNDGSSIIFLPQSSFLFNQVSNLGSSRFFPIPIPNWERLVFSLCLASTPSDQGFLAEAKNSRHHIVT